MAPNDYLDQVSDEMYNALQVIYKDPVIFKQLYNNDPKALKQCGDAIQAYINRNDREWMESYYNSKPAL